MRQVLADISAGIGIATVQNWSAVLTTAVIILLRIWLEILILRNKRKEK
jgi:hypothetical protein